MKKVLLKALIRFEYMGVHAVDLTGINDDRIKRGSDIAKSINGEKILVCRDTLAG